MRRLLPAIAALLVAGAAHADPPAPIELGFGGDVVFGRYGRHGVVAIAAERHDPFTRIRRLLRSDLTLVNLETPIARRPPRRLVPYQRNRMIAIPARVARLRRAGVDAVTLANNHAEDLDHADTTAVLAELGLIAVGAPAAAGPAVRAETVERAGWKLAIVAVTTVRNRTQVAGAPQLPFAEPADLAATVAPLVAAARADHDAVIVVVHWGREYADAPEPWQLEAGHALIDAGAIAVIGHHPHVLQPIERYQGGVIAYSLGNLLFDSHRPATRRGGLLRLTLGPGGCLDRARFEPTQLRWRPYLHVRPGPARDRRTVVQDGC